MTNLWDHLHQSTHQNLVIRKSLLEPAKTTVDYYADDVVKFSIHGLLVTVEFQKCKYIVESLYRCYPEKFEEPLVRPMLNLEWDSFLLNERRLKGGSLWTLKKCVAVYYNGIFIGDDTALCKYVSTRYILPMKNFYEMGREALREYFVDIMSLGRRCIYLMIAIDKHILGSMVFLLYEDLVPKTCRLFLKRCKKLKGGYTGTPIHRIVEASWIQCGGYRLNEVKLPCENFVISHDNRGILSMCNSGRHKNNTTQFLITLEKSTWMDTHYVAFGQLLHGDWVLHQIEAVPTKYQHPQKDVRIVRAGEFTLGFPRLGEGGLEKNLDRFLDQRLTRRKYDNYYARTELSLEKSEKLERNQRYHLDTDMKSHRPMAMLPTRIQEAFNYVPGKKSSCVFEVENCLKCGCCHDVGKCLMKTVSKTSYASD